jgi:hypothetical protein
MTIQSGTWTPAYVLTTSGSVTTNAASGKWFRLGSLCFFYAVLRSGSVTSPVGTVRLSLPFVAAAVTPLSIGTIDSWAAGITDLKASTYTNTAEVSLFRNNTIFVVTAADLSAANPGNFIRYGGLFEVA